MLPLSSPSTAPAVLAHPSLPSFEVADIVRAYGAAFRATHAVSHEQARVLRALAQCRTAALGGHVEQCVSCGTERVCYDSCRNRHCPKCQGSARAKWLAAEQALLLPIPYFHVVFTLPHQLNPLIRVNQRALYDLLFQTAAQTLQEFARDPTHLGAEIGITAVLHTWGQTLTEHIHVHCVVTGGGLSLDGTQWRACQRRFLFAVKALGEVFRGKYLAGLEQLRSQQRLTFAGESAPLAEEGAWNALRQHLYANPWVVYAKPPWGSPEQVLKYLSRYTHRVAIANSRLVFVGAGIVRLRYTDYAAAGTSKVMELTAAEFLRRFLLHVVPTGFVRIRHYGLLANRTRQEKLTRARQLLARMAATPLLSPVSVPAPDTGSPPAAATRCPHCAGTDWRRITRLLPQRGLPP
jgi:putative transposase/transposase-like zinc-binding protein